jgi:hypothetical protein
MRPSLRVLFVGVIVMLFAAGCGSSTKDAPASETSTTVAPGGECPFNGSTETQNEPGTNTATELTEITPSTDGCIDNVTYAFDPTLATSTVAYTSSAPGNGAVLVITLQNATLGGDLEAGTTIDPKSLNYDSKIVLSCADDAVEWRLTLDKQRPFVVSSSYLPPQLVVAIG